MLPLGTICLIKNVSPYSIMSNESYKKSFPILICPCSIPKIQRIIITDQLTRGLVLVMYENDKSKISVIAEKDLDPISLKTY